MAASQDPPVRINRFLADCGLGSRRSCESLVTEGRVQINGSRCESLSARVSPADQVTLDGRPLHRDGETTTLLLYKPPGYLCTRDDPEGRDTIFDLLPHHLRKRRNLSYAGRLDRDSEGLIVLTSSGEISQRLTHPGHEVEKEYVVNLTTPFRADDAERMVAGLETPVGFARAAAVERVSKRTVAIVLRQGLKRQIRHMLDALGYGVRRLVRVRIGGLTDSSLASGQWRLLGRRDLARVFGETVIEGAGNRRYPPPSNPTPPSR